MKITEEDIRKMLEIDDAGPWEPSDCPCCGRPVEVRERGLRLYEITGNENAKYYEFRPVQEEKKQ